MNCADAESGLFFLDSHYFFNLREFALQDSLDPHPEGHLGHRSTGAVAGEPDHNLVIFDADKFDVATVCLKGRSDLFEYGFYGCFVGHFYLPFTICVVRLTIAERQ